MWKNFAALEDHRAHADSPLGHIPIPGREWYGMRGLMTNAPLMIAPGGIEWELIEALRGRGIGPREVVEVDDLVLDCARGPVADKIRRCDGIRPFWFGRTEEELFNELGMPAAITANQMRDLNCKAIFRMIAKQQGFGHLVPLNGVGTTEAHALETFERIRAMLGHDGHPIPDAAILKQTGLLSGAGMEVHTTTDGVKGYCRRQLDGKPMIIEAAYLRHMAASAHWNLSASGWSRAGTTVNFISGGVCHEGNLYASHAQPIPGLLLKDMATMYWIGEHWIREWWKMGFREMAVGIDFIKVRGLCGRVRWYAIEPNIFRPPAPRYGFALGEQIAPRLGGRWAIAQSNVYPAPGAADNFRELARLLRGLLFDGKSGAVPTLVELLPHGKFQAFCVAENGWKAMRLLTRVKERVGDTKSVAIPDLDR
ncbi:MAG TPA: hypothetical protein DCY48_01690 [Candidatus Magasanikbacteria bacterium]|nr:MAG: hypothetical protein A3I74_00600 [Candidatus Magasanikbacteria bacterium RIFCSPLOWO2_02_FULL_47_16]OGH80050.1 MAG: hypothetical protein A3C10_02625 [Candidatus Magasanikbacteria bacterium RIFCSPHIGHO2_02_FULL_48_18]OGH82665.1 MAG: hypothetical protein A3G08_03120 [Candidatus Magasanikbacteria bacterium RIFCSPLOWO2_12_FULL_47_9b]HAZ28469.1 hypothetical protein [Candidatus Magasanikbacteria bacterium]